MPYTASSARDQSAQIMMQAAQNFTKGVQEYFQKQEQRQKQEATIDWLEQSGTANSLFPQLGQIQDPAERRKVITAGIKGAGLENLVQVQQYMDTRAQREREAQAMAEMRAVQMERDRVEMERIRREMSADDALNATVDQQIGLGQQLAGGTGGGVLRPEAQANAQAMMAGPAGQFRAQGVRLTGPMVADLMRAQMTHAPKPGKPAPGSAGFKRVEIPELGTLVVDTATGEPIDGGKVIRPHEKKNDEKALTATEIQQIQALQQAGRDLAGLESAYREIGDADWGGPVAGRVKALDPTNPNVSRISNLVTAATPNLARGVFREVGVLTDEDIKRYRKLLPDYTDTAAQRGQKLADLQRRLGEQTDETLRTLQAAGRDVNGLREKILGDRAQATGAPGAQASQFKGPDGQMHPIVTVRGRRGIVAGGKFYPLVE